jgi:hypothetical protein
MGKIQIVFVAVCLFVGLGGANPASHHVGEGAGQQVVRTAETQLGVREEKGRNDGPEVRRYLAYVGLPEGNPWCAAFVSWVFGANGYTKPKTAWTPDLFPLKRRCASFKAGNVYGLYSAEKKRIVHCGITKHADGDWVFGIEGNTNVHGSAEGDGVYLKRRHKRTIRLVADWIGGGER